MTQTPASGGGSRARPRVLLTTEGTYPHYAGGVSTWCDFLIRGVDDVDFIVWTLMMNPFIKQQFDFPDNVVNYVGVPLWGVEQPAEYTREIPSGKVFQTSRRTTERDIERLFVPIFTRFLDQMSAALFNPEAFAGVLTDMHAYFREWEYRTTWRSRTVWEAFKQHLVAPSGLVLPQAELEDDPDEERTRPVPRWDGIKNSFRYLVRGEDDEVVVVEGDEDVPTVGEAMEGLRWLYRLLQTLNVEVPESDVTHSAAAAFCAIPCLLAKAERGTPFLLTEHGVYLREQYLNIERSRFPYNLKRFLIDLVSAVAQTSYHLADQISPVCHFNTRWEIAYGATEDRIQVIYNGVSPETYRPLSVERPSRPTVVQVGRIDPLKDQLTFLKVADAVRKQIPDVLFLHWGPESDDEYAEEVHKLHRELGLKGTVEFKGYTSQVAEAYSQGDISLMTSISEAFPYGVVESMMCATPVVSTAVGGVREALDGTGATAPAQDVEGLARAVVELLRKPRAEIEDLSRRSRERALEHFTLHQFVDEYRESYHRLAELGAARRAADRAPTPQLPPGDAPTDEIPAVGLEDPLPPPAPSEPEAVEPEEEIGVAELLTALAQADPFARTGAISRLRPEPEAVPVLRSALSDPYPQVRRAAIHALARIGGPEASRILTSVAISDPAAEVREEAVTALGPLIGREDTEYGAGA